MLSRLQELSAIAERIYGDDNYDDAPDDDGAADAGVTGTFTVRGYDGLQPHDYIIEPFDVEVTYSKSGGGHTDHPYGSTTAREHHGVEVEIDSMVCVDDVVMRDPTTDEVTETIPAGTELDQIPGFTEHDAAFFQDKAEDHAN